MQPQLLILPVLVPVVFWATYHYHKDRHLPEPVGNLLLCFVLGVFATSLSHALYVSLGPLGLRYDASALADTNTAGLFAYSMLAIGPIEEFSKFLPFAVIVLRFRALDEPIDGIIYASFIGLGYATMENVQYLDYLTPLEAIARGFAGPVVHIVFASIWGHWVAAAHLNGRGFALAAFASVSIAAALHGLYDFAVLLNPGYSLPIAALIIVSLWLWRLRLLRNMHRLAISRPRTGADSNRKK
jgi:RsiW-degrading membrane proteinase PrsW (M82 family)